MPAAVAKLCTACSASCGSNGGWPSGMLSGSSTSQTTNGRPDRSRATSTSASSSGNAPLAKRRTPGLVAQRLAEGLAEGDGHVLHGVVAVDVEVALGLDQ